MRRDEATTTATTTTRRWLGLSRPACLPACFSLFLPHPSRPPPSLLATSSRRLGGYTASNRFTAPTTHSSRSQEETTSQRRSDDSLDSFFFFSDSSYVLLFFSLPSFRPAVFRALAKTTRLRRKRAMIGGQASPCSFHSAPLPFSSPAHGMSLSPSSALMRSAVPSPLSLSLPYSRGKQQRTS